MGKRRRKRPVKSMLALLLAVLVYLLFPGILPRSGSGTTGADPTPDPGEARTEADPTPEVTSSPADVDIDLVAGRRERMRLLLAGADYAEARRLATAFVADKTHPGLVQVGRDAIALIDAAATGLEGKFRTALAEMRYDEAEALLGRLFREFPDRRAGLMAELGVGTSLATELSLPAIEKQLAPLLPFALAEDRTLWKVHGGRTVVKERKPSGGFRYRTLDWGNLDPTGVSRLLDRVAGLRRPVAQIYLAAGRPVAAALVLDAGNVKQVGERAVK